MLSSDTGHETLSRSRAITSISYKPPSKPSTIQSQTTNAPSAHTLNSKPRKVYDFPRSPIISADVLAKYIHEVPEMILLLDIRAREEFDEGHIYSSNVVNIDPIVLRSNQSSIDLEDALIISPQREQDLFSRRNQFELIVYYDRNSRTNQYVGGPTSDLQQIVLRNLVNTIYEFETVKSLKRQPCLLVGGIEAWVEYCGKNSLVSSRSATNTMQKAKYMSLKRDTSPNENTSRIHNSLSAPPPPSSAIEYYDEIDIDKEREWLNKVHSSYSTSSLPDVSTTRHLTELPHSHFMHNSKHQPVMVSSSVATPPIEKSASTSTSDVYARNMNEFFRRRPIAPNDMMPKRPPPVADRLSYDGRSSAHRMPVAGTSLPSLQPKNGSYQPINSVATLPPSTTVTRTEKQHSIGNNFSGLGEVSAGMTGLKNLGNTCYMNSVIQCIAGTSSLARFFLSGAYKKQINVRNKLGSQGLLARAFGDLVSALYSDQCTFLIPTTMKDVSGRLRPEFSGYDQQDAQEFLTFLLDTLHEDLNINGGKPRLPPLTEKEERVREQYTVRYASFLEWERYLRSDNSAIVSIFQGQYQSRLTCTTCGFTSTTYNPFSCLSLPLAPGSRVSLKDCFDLFVAEEILDKEDAWNCTDCKQQRKAMKALKISRLPLILIIHLKRFKVNGRWSNKLDTFVDFPLHNLDLTSYWPEYTVDDQKWLEKFPPNDQKPPFKYNLYGVVNHYGSVRGGHYTALVHKNNKGWLIFDDSRVAMCSRDKVVTKDAYVLFYERVRA
ncbi:hypothetical protein V1511DRAFT_459397 [Dipodascopsis uninucleata]